MANPVVDGDNDDADDEDAAAAAAASLVLRFSIKAICCSIVAFFTDSLSCDSFSLPNALSQILSKMSAMNPGTSWILSGFAMSMKRSSKDSVFRISGS